MESNTNATAVDAEVPVHTTSGNGNSEIVSSDETPQPRRNRSNTIKVRVPKHKRNVIKRNWSQITFPLVEDMKLRARFYIKALYVELSVTPETPKVACLIKGAEFFKAFIYGFELKDALQLLYIDNTFLDSFRLPSVEMLNPESIYSSYAFLSSVGETKFIIERTTRSRIVLVEDTVYVIGSSKNIRRARRAVLNLLYME
ncbi:hypothetical protein AWZ03_010573 [Drosophila navojoa]|uniref:PNO1 second type I KH domain-containing protein n=1 Tax=Drosophila navojoa TaxID=7232 RepID=A0A484B2M6_DRONA|nr:RNA-binding protein pno1-like [Drosophila navojoa]TDG42988.1 hypothetical protein AWZ03_010573 [Drosophila navojoa]